MHRRTTVYDATEYRFYGFIYAKDEVSFGSAEYAAYQF